MSSNNAIIYKEPPTNYPENGKHLAFEKRHFNLHEISLEPDEFITENLFVSIDPYQRGRMRPESTLSYAPPFKAGEPIPNSGVAKIVKSNNPNFHIGQIVYGPLEWSEYTKISAQTAQRFFVIENKYNLPLSNFVGAIGMPGMTAYSSFYEIGKPKKGETIFISAASGAVGQIVGQLAKREGLYVVGSAGADDKVKYLLEELKFDGAFNYKSEKPSEALGKYCPKGIDIYFENVGGETLEAVLDAANNHSRVIACGMISQYNTPDKYGIKNLMQVVAKRITIQGFIVSDFWGKYQAEFYGNMEKWLSEGSIKYQEDIANGLENGADAFIGMLHGKNFGKAIIDIKGKSAL